MARPLLTVTVDARAIFDFPRRGIAKTTIASYRALAVIRPDWRIVMLHRQPPSDDPFRGLPNVRTARVEIAGDKYQLWERVRLPVANVLAGADIFHAPAGPAPPKPLVRMVTTIHDLIPLDFRPDAPDVIDWVASVRRGARNADGILTGSRYSRDQIVKHFGEPVSKINLINWAPSRSLDPPVLPLHRRTSLGKYGIPPGSRYVLHFGMEDPRKNTSRTLDAWAQVDAVLRRQFPLVVVGVAGPALDRFRSQVERLGIGETATVHGYVPEDDVAPLLARAEVLCYPTSHEGFGLPILDGFAAGACVLTGNQTSLPEVAGDAALLVDVSSTAAVASGLTALLSSLDLRRDLVQRGRDRLREYTWERTAETMAGVFERVAGRG